MLNQRTVHIPDKGCAPALQDVLASRVASYYSTPSTAGPHIDSGKLIPLATTGLARSAFLPNVPTIAESGYPGFNATNWYAFVAPGQDADTVLDRWNQELTKVLGDTEVKAELDHHGLTPAPGSRENLARFIDSESQTWGASSRSERSQRNRPRLTPRATLACYRRASGAAHFYVATLLRRGSRRDVAKPTNGDVGMCRWRWTDGGRHAGDGGARAPSAVGRRAFGAFRPLPLFTSSHGLAA